MNGSAPPQQAESPGDAAYCDPASFTAEAQGHSLSFHPEGRDRFEALMTLIGEARESLRVAFYIFAEDNTGRRVRDALTDAARRGVEVTLVVDGYGSDASEDFFAPLRAAGGTVCRFIAKWSRRYLIRNHQKIVVADGEHAMLGGFNVEDSYFAPPEENGWNDLAVRIEGPVVARVTEWFDELERWAADSGAQFRAVRRMVRRWDGGEPPVQLLIGGPSRRLSSWARCVRKDMERAGQRGGRLDMMMAYFSPPPHLRKAIRRIAEGGEARLILAGKSDNGATIGAARALYRKMLGAGVRVFEFQPCKLHTKLIVIDDAVYFGSANFDMRSLYVNLEIVLRIEDAALAERLRAFIGEHEAASTAITPETYRRMGGPLTRLKWWASWFLVSVVDYTVSRRLNLGL